MHALFTNAFAIVHTRSETTTFATADAFTMPNTTKGRSLSLPLPLCYFCAAAGVCLCHCFCVTVVNASKLTSMPVHLLSQLLLPCMCCDYLISLPHMLLLWRMLCCQFVFDSVLCSSCCYYCCLSAVTIASGFALMYPAALVSTHVLGVLVQGLLLSCVQLLSMCYCCMFCCICYCCSQYMYYCCYVCSCPLLLLLHVHMLLHMLLQSCVHLSYKGHCYIFCCLWCYCCVINCCCCMCYSLRITLEGVS
jgi:hypothetical protein